MSTRTVAPAAETTDPVNIEIFLPTGSPDGLRIAEISNWNGKALVCPRTALDHLLGRSELRNPGVYILVGNEPDTEEPAAYVGEAEGIGKRLRDHRDKDFWTLVLVFLSKDDKLTKAHVKFLEGELIARGEQVGKAVMRNKQPSGARLSEADTAVMRVFFAKMLQLLPILGVPYFERATEQRASGGPEDLMCKIKGLIALGRRTVNGFLVFKGSQAVAEHRSSATRTKDRREELKARGVLVVEDDHLTFSRDYEFSSPSAAAATIRGGASNGLTSWKDKAGRSLKEIEAGS